MNTHTQRRCTRRYTHADTCGPPRLLLGWTGPPAGTRRRSLALARGAPWWPGSARRCVPRLCAPPQLTSGGAASPELQAGGPWPCSPRPTPASFLAAWEDRWGVCEEHAPPPGPPGGEGREPSPEPSSSGRSEPTPEQADLSFPDHRPHAREPAHTVDTHARAEGTHSAHHTPADTPLTCVHNTRTHLHGHCAHTQTLSVWFTLCSLHWVQDQVCRCRSPSSKTEGHGPSGLSSQIPLAAQVSCRAEVYSSASQNPKVIPTF